MIKVTDAEVRYAHGPAPALAGVTVDIPETRVGVIGANGSGKSTFVRLLNGLVTPTAGRVEVAGMDVAANLARVRATVGFLFQNPEAQVVMPTVIEDVAFGPNQQGAGKADAEARALQTLKMLDIERLAQRDCYSLSGGELQLVALAGVLVMAPSVLVLDEPTSLLDARYTRRLMALIDAYCADHPQAQVLHVTHRLDELAGVARVLAFEGGRIVLDGPPGEVVPAYEKMMEKG